MRLDAPVRRDALLVVAASLALVAVACLVSPAFFEGTDWILLHLPNKAYAAEALGKGALPLWNPYVGLGRPFLADTETAVLYPPNLLYLALDPPTALLLLTIAHYALGLVGLLMLGRAIGLERWTAWTVAACFLWSAPLVARLAAGQVPYAHATCYLPLLFVLALRLQDSFSPARLAALAVALALQLLCGHPQIAWVTWLGLAAFLLGRALPPVARPLRAGLSGIGGLVLGILAAFALAGPMLLPFLELVSEGNRAVPSVAFSSGGTLEWWQWTSLALPDGGRRVFHWEANLYAGLLPVVAGLAGLLQIRDRNVRGLLLAGLAGGLVAAGTRTPAFVLLYHLVPGLASFHIHSRAAVLVVLALLLGAGLLLSRERLTRRTTLALAIGATLAATAPLALQVALPQAAGRPGPAPLARLALVAAVATLAGASLRLQARAGRVAARVALALVVLADLGFATTVARRTWHFPLSFAGERMVFEDLLDAGLYDENGVPPRIALPPWIVRQNAAPLYKWANVAGYNALTLERVWVFLHATLGLAPPLDENTYPSRHIYDFGPFPWDTTNLVAGWDPAENRVVLRRPTEADPRAWLTPVVRAVPSWREAIEAMAAGHDVHRISLVETDVGLPREGDGEAPGRVELTSFEPERVVLETESSARALLVLAEAWYPGWRASVDGEPAACLPANGWMRAVPVPAGHHRVELRFHSRWLLPGTLLSLLTAAALGVAVQRERRRRKAEDPPTARGPTSG